MGVLREISKVLYSIYGLPDYSVIFIAHSLFLSVKIRRSIGNEDPMRSFLYTAIGLFGGRLIESILLEKPLVSLVSENEIAFFLLSCWFVFYSPMDFGYYFTESYPVKVALDNAYNLILVRGVVSTLTSWTSSYSKEAFPLIIIHPAAVLFASIKTSGGFILVAVFRSLEGGRYPDFRKILRQSVAYSLLYLILCEFADLTTKRVEVVMSLVAYTLMICYNVLFIDLLEPLERYLGKVLFYKDNSGNTAKW